MRKFLLLSVAAVAFTAVVLCWPSTPVPAVPQTQIAPVQPVEQVPGVLAAVNEYRATKQLAPLKLDTQLNASAQAKAGDLVLNQYWSHTTLDGREPWSFIREAGYSYTEAGENLAKCYDSADAVVQAWIASPTHEAVLVGDYADVGFGTERNASDGCYYVVGHFGAKR